MTAAVWSAAGVPAVSQEIGRQPILHQVEGASQRMEMVVNTSRILKLDQRIPRAQVNNPEILELTPLSANQIQMLAKKAGVTQVNLWDENDEIHTIDVLVYGDAQELTLLLKSQFPKASIKIVPLSGSAVVTGYVDDPAQVDLIIKIAEDYYPKIINNIRVGGVQQVLLQLRVMEVSRTKLRTVGMDWANITSGGDFVFSSVSGLLAAVSNTASSVTTTGGETFAYGIIEPGHSFFGVLELLQQNNLAKILAEPQLVTVSGRPAFFNSGGEFPILVPQSLGTVSIQYKKFGTQIDFVPIVLGNGGIRLEVRPRVSEIDDSRSVVINNTSVPGLRVREVDTGVEMRAGQTLAIAGLVQTRVEASKRGLPWISDVPFLGAPFRRVREQTNEIELLVLVTPQLVEAMDPCEVPPCGPGLETTSPNDMQLYLRGHLEVPSCGPCGIGGTCDVGGQSMSPPAAVEIIEEHEQTLPTPSTAPDIDDDSYGPGGLDAGNSGSGASARRGRSGSSRRVSATRSSRPIRLPSTRTSAVEKPRISRPSAGPALERPSSRRSNSQNRQNLTGSSAQAGQGVEKSPPSFVGPLGYDVVK